MSSILQRSEVFTQSYLPRAIFLWGMLLKCAVGSAENTNGTCNFSAIASWLSLDLHVSVGVSLRMCSVLFRHLSIDCFLGDCFCDIITCHYCFFFVYFFNVVHVFCVMRNSSNGDIFYCVIILTAICFNTVKIEKLE